MDIEKMFQDTMGEIDRVPVICDEGLEHSENWIEFDKGEKFIACSKCYMDHLKDNLYQRDSN